MPGYRSVTTLVKPVCAKGYWRASGAEATSPKVFVQNGLWVFV